MLVKVYFAIKTAGVLVSVAQTVQDSEHYQVFYYPTKGDFWRKCNINILEPPAFKEYGIHCIGSWKHFVCVCVSLSLYLSSSRSLSSPDDKLSENIWFVWSKTSYDGDKWTDKPRKLANLAILTI